MRLRSFASFAVMGTGLIVLSICGIGQNRANQGGNNDLGFTDTPMLPGLPYHVHDPARPYAPVAAPAAQPGGPPSDAIVLFDGKDLSAWESGERWKVRNGFFEVAPGTGDLKTKAKFGDCQLHIEWAAPVEVRGRSQGRGNSGVFLQGLYEIQVLDSYDNPTYADGQAGAIYGQWPPLANATRKPGEWQAYDIVFEAPRFEGERVVKPAYLTVFLNSVLLHNRRELMGPTVYRQVAKYTPQPAEGPLVLQDHGNPVQFRNIWIRRLAL
jgi:3-keto-disaccharide hydrolase